MTLRSELPTARGFTLTELLIVMALLGLVMAVMLGLFMAGQDSYVRGTSMVDAQQSARVAVEQLVREIRSAGYDPTGASFAAITGATATAFTLQNDWNGNGAIEPGITVPVTMADGSTVPRGEQVTYSLFGITLRREESGLDAQPQPVVDGIEPIAGQPLFEYRDATGAVTATTANIRTVVVALKARPPAQSGAGSQVEIRVTDRVRLRNR